MQNILFDELCIKRIKKYFLIFAIACVGVMSVVYTPIYLLISSNVLWSGTALLFLLTEVVGPIIDYTFYLGSFAFLIYVYLRFGKRQIKWFSLIYAVAAVTRYLFTMLVNFVLMSFPTREEILYNDLSNLLLGTVMDCLQILGVLLLAEFCCRRPMMSIKTYAKATQGEEMVADCFPIEGFINFKKPISKLCFFAALIPAGLKMLSRLYYDIFVWGLPQEIEEWLLVSTYYVGDIASFFIGYFALLYVLQLFYTDETKRRIDFES